MDLFGLRRRRRLSLLRKGVEKLLSTKVREAMTDYVVTISPHRSAIDAATIMVGESVSAIVVERDGKPLGILTERDFITKVPATNTVFKLPVERIMSANKGDSPVEIIDADATLLDAYEHMQKKKIRKLVVLNKERLIQGIITQTDLSKAIYHKLFVVANISGIPFEVRQVMTEKVISVSSKAMFSDAKRIMLKSDVSSLPVLNGKEYVGIFTEYDVVMQFYDAGGKLEIKRMSEIMKSPVKAMPAEHSLFEANAIMLFERVRRLMVVEGEKVLGIVTQTDLIHGCMEYAIAIRKRLDEDATLLKLDDLVEVKRKDHITSVYVGPHMRAYTMG